MRDTFELPMISRSTCDVSLIGVLSFSWWLKTELLLAAVFFRLGWCILPFTIVGRILNVELQLQSHYFIRFFCELDFTFFSLVFFRQQHGSLMSNACFCASCPSRLRIIFASSSRSAILIARFSLAFCVSICLSSSCCRRMSTCSHLQSSWRDTFWSSACSSMMVFLAEANSLFRSLFSCKHLL